MTIPTEFRKALRIEPDGFLQVTLEDGELRVRPLRVAEPAAGSPWLKELYELVSPVRAEAAQESEEEINQAIDRAVKAVRRRRA